jgi:nicotinamide-nucleotide amidase
VKERVLTVSGPILSQHGAVSEETARAMVDGVRSLTGADAAVAVTGIAGPTGGTPDKPVGTVWVAAAVGERSQARRYIFGGDRTQIRARSAQAALALLHQLLASQRA